MHMDKTASPRDATELSSRLHSPPISILPPVPVVLAPVLKPQESSLRFTKESYYAIERWEPCEMTEAQAEAAREFLNVVSGIVAPADKGRLLTRILTLLSHYRTDPNPAQVEFMIAEDWAEDLGEFPAWAVDEAARQWRRSRKFKPQICEIREACQRIVGLEMQLVYRLRRLLEAHETRSEPGRGRSAKVVTGLAARLRSTC